MARSATHLLPVLLLAAGCAPQTAVLTEGEYWAFLSESTSFSLEKGTVDPADWEDQWNIDCRDLKPKEREALGLDDPLAKVCDNAGGVKVEYESWLSQSAWHVLHESMEPWRGEAIITGEGDFQVGFHHRLPGGSDFRFAFVVDPDFQPTECEADENGNIKAVPLDGNWLEEWTESLRALGKGKLDPGYGILEEFIDDEDATLYFLNARSFQFNPGDTEDLWSIPPEWQAGYAAGKFAEEDFHSRSARFAEPALYDFVELTGGYYGYETDPNDLFFCDLEAGSDPAASTCVTNKIDHVADIVGEMAKDLALVGVTDQLVDENKGQGDAMYAPIMHDNLWRVPDGFPPGFDGWVELHYNYVVISGKVEPGESVHGAFSLVLDGDESNSRWIVQGKFEVPVVKEDKWTTIDLEQTKIEENGTISCHN